MSDALVTDQNTNGGSTVNLTFGQNGDAVQFDAVTMLTPTITVDVTEFPVESGAILADSTIVRPREWSFTGIVSNTPLRKDLFPLIDTTARLRTVAVYQRLEQAMLNREPVQYTDDLDDVPVCAITQLSTTRTVDTAGSLVLQLTVREILIATVQTIKQRVVTHNGVRQNRGTVSPVQLHEPSPAVTDVNGNVIASLNASGQLDEASNIATTAQQKTAVPTLTSESPAYNSAATGAPTQPTIYTPSDVSPAVSLPREEEAVTWR